MQTIDYIILFAMAAAGTVSAASDEFSIELEAIRGKHDVPALAAAAVRDGQVIESAVTGVRKSASPEPVTIEDQWHIGSCTKSMTATLAAMLVDDGVLKWETKIGDVFRDGSIQSEWKDVSLDQLLVHRGGAPGEAPVKLWREAGRQIGAPRDQRAQFVRGLLSQKPSAPAGSKFIYSNQGYAIAGAMLEKLTGKPWEELMRSRLFAPLHMASAGFGAPATPGKVDQPWGHRRENGQLQPVPPGPAADNPPAIGPAGTVHCSIRDFARYAGWHAREGAAVDPALSEPAFSKLHQPGAGQDYAMGWGVTRRGWAGGVALSHSGSNTMFCAVMWIAPRKNAAFVAATNVAGKPAESACDEAVAALIKRVLP